MNIVITPSDKTNKKNMAILDNKKIHFGDSRYSDYTKHKDPERKKSYLSRHKKTLKESITKTLMINIMYASN